jgi:hypothetical protein
MPWSSRSSGVHEEIGRNIHLITVLLLIISELLRMRYCNRTNYELGQLHRLIQGQPELCATTIKLPNNKIISMGIVWYHPIKNDPIG